MKKIAFIIGLLVVVACSSTKYIDSWKNKEITSFKPQKLLVIGITDNLTARKIFEEELKKAFITRNIHAEESILIFDDNFTKSKKSEVEIDKMIKKISNEGFDAVVITAVKGVDEKRSYNRNYNTVNNRWSKFGYYYFIFQDVYFTPDYYETYKVYTIETYIYSINEKENKSLIWVGSFNLVNPQKITPTIKDYVNKIIKQLETDKLI